MRENFPSATAHRVALRRAAHQVFDNPRVFEDPLALRILGIDTETLAASAPEHSERASRYLRAFLIARSRYAEDELAKAVARGARNYILLGAGLDTFAYRNPHPGLRVFEIDHPATQAWKRSRLEAAGISLPELLTFVAVDFEKQTFLEALDHAGYKSDAPAFFSWLGVTPYLLNAVVLSNLCLIFAASPESSVVFDYAVPRSLLTPLQQAALDSLAARVASAGEPFRGFFDPSHLAEELRVIGFRYLEDLGSDEINSRYFQNRADDLRVGGGLAHLMCARS